MGKQLYGGVTVPRETFNDLEQLETSLSSSKAAIVVALTELFKSLPAEVQASFLDRRRDPAAEIAKWKLAGTDGLDLSEVSLDEAVSLARQAIERVEIIGHAYQQQLGVKDNKSKKGKSA